MHIVIDARLINSGSGTYAVKTLDYLQKIDNINQYSVIVYTKDRDYWRPTAKNFRIVTTDIKYFTLAEQIGFKRFLEELTPDLVHFMMPQQPVLYRGKCVTTIHDLTLLKVYNSDKNWLIYHIKQLIGRWVFKRIAKTNRHIIVVSNNSKREYQDYSKISDDKISMIYEAGEKSKGKAEPYDLPYDDFIMYVGQHPDYKNLRRLAEAHQLLLEEYPKLGLVFVGRLNTDTLINKNLFEKRNYKNILFTGFLPDSQRDWLMTKTRAYVFPSLMEGFGLPPLEAMLNNAPVVSSNASCLPEVLGDAAVYFDPLDVNDMADTIKKVICDDKLRQQMIKKGHHQVSKYSWRQSAEETHAVYMKVLSED